jgi:hypothetical protein
VTFFLLLVRMLALVHVPPLARVLRAPTRRDKMRVQDGRHLSREPARRVDGNQRGRSAELALVHVVAPAIPDRLHLVGAGGDVGRAGLTSAGISANTTSMTT